MRMGFITGIGAAGHILVKVKGRRYDRNGYDFDHAWTLCGRSTEQTWVAAVTWETDHLTESDCQRCLRKANGRTDIECVEVQ